MTKTRLFFLWLGASISLAEIYTGSLLAPLGLAKGIAVIIGGHIAGTAFLAFAGFISFKQNKTAMESAAFSLGEGGGKLATVFNIIQLIGWAIVMVVQGAIIIVKLIPSIPFPLCAASLAILVVVWTILLHSPGGGIFHNIIVCLLFILCVILAASAGLLPVGTAQDNPLGNMTLTLAIELTVAMPISYLPLIGDYTKNAKTKTAAAFMPFAGYFFGACLMWIAGLYISIRTGKDIFSFITLMPFKTALCAVILLSTLSTTFIDLYSASVSLKRFLRYEGLDARRQRLTENKLIICTGMLVIVLASLAPVDKYSELLSLFLTAIASVFIPVYGIVFADFCLKRGKETRIFPVFKLFTVAAACAVYHISSRFNAGIPTLNCIAVVALLSILPLVFYRSKK
ncbi:MAG: putative hydroxymethylpyrimidine transporter CytX [Termitinemataceae bacterium]|nr:MAG: putative hydroxymethylpyrimidine transporter CytX [Termitinemataceae bacterium]